MTERATPITRWSTARYTNLDIPSYIPSEALVHEKGQFLRAFLLRALAIDMQRMLVTGACEQYFANLTLIPEYDAHGNRSNTPENVISEKRLHVMDEIGKLLRTYVDRNDTGKKGEITRKIYLTPEQIESGAWGAIIGARGSVHQQLEKETRCHIVLAGRGITNVLKDTNPNAAALAMEEPHVRLTATSEQDLQAAAERVEWIMSDDPAAVEFRERNRRRTAQVEGRYDPTTWVPLEGKKTAGEDGTAAGGKRPRPAEDEAATQVDAELDEFLEDL